MVRIVAVMSVITAKAEKAALIGRVWPIVRRHRTHFPGIAVAITGVEAGSVAPVGVVGFIAGA
jgi:hypothetical protein